MRALLILFAMCLLVTFIYPLTTSSTALAELAVFLGMFGSIIVFFTIITLVCQEATFRRDQREKWTDFKMKKAMADDEEIFDADYEEEP